MAMYLLEYLGRGISYFLLVITCFTIRSVCVLAQGIERLKRSKLLRWQICAIFKSRRDRTNQARDANMILYEGVWYLS